MRESTRVPAPSKLERFLRDRLSPYSLPDVKRMTFERQISYVYSPSWGRLRPSNLARAALGYLRAKVPVQVLLDDADLHFLLSGVVDNELAPKRGRPKWLLNRVSAMAAFPPKRLPQALTKANLFIDEVCRDLWALDSVAMERAVPYLEAGRTAGWTNDQATAFLLYGYSVSKFTDLGFAWSATALSAPDDAKEVSNFLKAVGAQAVSFGSLLVEVDTLRGRGVGSIDLLAESKNRCNADYVAREYTAVYPDDELRRAIVRILKLEISREDDSYAISYPTLADHWDSRWAWAVNGSHSNKVDGGAGLEMLKDLQVHKIHRRAWLETRRDDPRLGWSGRTIVSPSPKLEAGKTRAIFACDTVSYLAFEHLLGSVERRWRGNRVILNPGKGGSVAIGERVKHAKNRSGVSMMLDYDDFNSHHTLRAMEILIEETCKLTGYDKSLSEKLVSSFSQQYITYGSWEGRVVGTLMSGHRATTYVNSVLNMAYLMCELGHDYVFHRATLHVGDDVYFGARSYGDADYVIRKIMSSRLRMNRSKQSVGHVSTEFLRVATSGRESYGYLARAIASTVAGNWVSERRIDAFQALTSMVTASRTLANRSRNNFLPLLLVSSVKRTLNDDSFDDSLLREILCGSVAVNNGPCFVSGGVYRQVSIKPRYITRNKFGYGLLPDRGTSKYLSTQAKPLEVETLTRAGITPHDTMLDSSYRKSLELDQTYLEGFTVGPITSTPAIGSALAERVVRAPNIRGVLLEYPLLVLVKNRLPEQVVRDAVGMAGGNSQAVDISLEAWGEYRHGCIVNTVLSYTDAASLGKKTTATVLTSNHRYYV
jgi:hypothetical protein